MIVSKILTSEYDNFTFNHDVQRGLVMELDILSLLNGCGIEIAETTNGSYVVEWIDSTTQVDYDFIIRCKDDSIFIAHPLGRPSVANHTEIKHVICNIVKPSLCGLSVLEQNDGDLMIYKDLAYSESDNIINILLEISRYKDIIRYSFIWELLFNDDNTVCKSAGNCDWCGEKTIQFHTFQSLELCQECYLHQIAANIPQPAGTETVGGIADCPQATFLSIPLSVMSQHLTSLPYPCGTEHSG